MTTVCDLAASSVAPPLHSIERPSHVRPWSYRPWRPSLSNLSRIKMDPQGGASATWSYPRLFQPSNRTSETSWLPHLWASQFPSRCDRYLLIEDDLKGQGFGYSVMFYEVALLMAMSEGRVLLEVPVDPTWKPLGANASRVWAWNDTFAYARSYHHAPAREPRWCQRPPYTLQCFLEPWTHCPVPPVSKHVAPGMHPAWAYVIFDWPRSSPIVRLKLSWLMASWFMWQGKTSRARDDARRFLVRHRSWVREKADCVLAAAGRVEDANTPVLRPLHTSLYVRDSAEKRHEMRIHGHHLPPLTSLTALAATASAAISPPPASSTSSASLAVPPLIVVHTSSPNAIGNVSALGAATGDFRTVATSGPRSDHDSWGGWQHSNVSSSMEALTMEGVMNAVNIELASRSGVFVGPIFSSWSDLLRALLLNRTDMPVAARQPHGSVGGGYLLSFCCACSRKERLAMSGNTWVIISAGLPPDAQERVLSALTPAAALAPPAGLGGCIRAGRL